MDKTVPPNSSSRESLQPLCWLLGGYTLFFWALACRKYSMMNSNSGDAAAQLNAFWYTIHGKFFYSYMDQMCHFGIHVTPAILVCLPFFWLAPSMYTLLFMQSLVLAASGWPFYLIARQTLENKVGAYLMTVGFLFFPTIVTNHVNQIHWEYWALPYLLAAVYFFVSNQFWPFLGFALLGMTGQESLPLTVAMFGIYAAIRRRGCRWIVAPMALALAYGLFAFNIVIPHFAGERGYIVTHYFEPLAHSTGGLIVVCLTQPQRVLAQILNLDRAAYLLKLLQPLLLVTPFASWEVILAVPSVGISLLVNDTAFRTIPWHYNPTSGALLCVAAIFGVRRIGDWLERRGVLSGARTGLTLAICLVSLASWPLWLIPEEYVPQPYYPTLRRVLDIVPPDKSVIAPLTMLSHFGDRAQVVHQIQFDPNDPINARWPKERMYTFDYVILDGNEWRFPQERVTRELVMSFYTNTNYELIFNENNVLVFRHREGVSSSQP